MSFDNYIKTEFLFGKKEWCYMKYRLRGNFTKNSAECLRELLEARGITDWQSYIRPNSSAELSPYDLENIEAGVKMVLRHLKRNSNICILVDSD